MTQSSSNKSKKIAVLMLMPLVLIIDQLVKSCIRARFEAGESLPLIKNVFHITYVQNRGAAFGIFADTPYFTFALQGCMVLLIVGALIYVYKQDEMLLMLALTLVCAGGIGNLIDRFRFGYVVDMFDFRVFPVFNVADIAVTCGCGIAVIWVLFGDRKKENAQDQE